MGARKPAQRLTPSGVLTLSTVESRGARCGSTRACGWRIRISDGTCAAASARPRAGMIPGRSTASRQVQIRTRRSHANAGPPPSVWKYAPGATVVAVTQPSASGRAPSGCRPGAFLIHRDTDARARDVVRESVEPASDHRGASTPRAAGAWPASRARPPHPPVPGNRSQCRLRGPAALAAGRSEVAGRCPHRRSGFREPRRGGCGSQNRPGVAKNSIPSARHYRDLHEVS